jgi:tRNA/rRNA methyltransferase
MNVSVPTVQSISTANSLFSRMRVVLVETSHPGNIGAVARAMKTMGFVQLVLVNPRFDDALMHPDAVAFASGAQDVLASAQIVTSIDEALHGCHFVAAVSARLREFSPPVWEPRALAEHLGEADPQPFALVFGNERFGLPNEIVLKCNALINIPAHPQYSSLNLAQAVQLLCYEMRVAALRSSSALVSETEVGFKGKLATAQEVEGMFSHLEQALVAIEFLDPAQPKRLMPRLKRMFSRTQLETEEVNILRGIAARILHKQ